MKKKFVSVFLIFSFLISSCSSDFSNSNDQFLKRTSGYYGSLNKEIFDISYVSDSDYYYIIVEVEHILKSSLSEKEKREKLINLLLPFEKVGREILQAIIEFNKQGQVTFSFEEESYIRRVNSEQLALFGFIMNSAYFLKKESSLNNHNLIALRSSSDKILDCLGEVSGVYGLYEIVKNTKELASIEAATSRQAIKLLGKIGKRFLGWMGVALLIRDFGDCMELW